MSKKHNIIENKCSCQSDCKYDAIKTLLAGLSNVVHMEFLDKDRRLNEAKAFMARIKEVIDEHESKAK